MTRGALLFAYNNDYTDYLALAAWSAGNIRRHLAIPVAVITNITDSPLSNRFDQVIHADPAPASSRWFGDYETHVTWHNVNRWQAYDLTPWDHTLLLDTDYVVASDRLATVFKSQPDLLCFRHSNLLSDPDQLLLPTFGRHAMPMYWATVIWFRRSPAAAYVFDAMHMIQQHWSHYRELYGINEDTFRNDYALSIALGIVNGHSGAVDTMPWSMPSALPEQTLEMRRLDDQHLWFLSWQNDQAITRSMSFSGIDFHAMGKRDLGAAVATSR